LKKDDGVIDWSLSAARLHNLVRGLHPWPHAFTFLRGARFIVHRTGVVDTSDAVPGTILVAAGDDLIVATGDGALRVREIQAEGKRPMTTREFLAGHRLASGDRCTAAP
jgi:methionyl-tRNA formyltransferase